MKILLVNTNQIKPPIAPIGLDYLADAVDAAGAQVEILDSCREDLEVAKVVSDFQPDCVGVTFRNTDDCYFSGQDFFVPTLKTVTEELRRVTKAPLVLGGVGFSIMPELILEACGLSYGIMGEGEFLFPELAGRLVHQAPIYDLPGLIFKTQEGYHRNPPKFGDLSTLRVPSRRWFDNQHYFREGGQIGFETKRGCDQPCIFCADPVAKGAQIRLHPPRRILEEIKGLVTQDIDHFHTCDAEFNAPEQHALAVCQALIESGIAERIRWYAYCSPLPFSRELAKTMVRAGCAGIDFGVDHSEESMLARLGRKHRARDLERVADLCHELQIPFMFDLLLGGPGETLGTLQSVIGFMKHLNPSRVGLSVGVRIYPGTPLAAFASREPTALRSNFIATQGTNGQLDLLCPLFYISPDVGDEIFERVGDYVGEDSRFLFADPNKKEQNYNYNDNHVLAEALSAGYRGAYWDILRRIKDRL